MSWKEDTKLFEAKAKAKVKCKCGHSMTLSRPTRICPNCGVLVKNKEEQKKDFDANLKRALER